MLTTAQTNADRTRAQSSQRGTLRGFLIFFVIAIMQLAGTGIVRAQVQTRLQAVSASTHRATRAVLPRNIEKRHKSPRTVKLSASARARVIATYGRVPLRFEANTGQTASQVRFLSRGPGYTLFLTRNEAVLGLNKPASGNHGRKMGQQLLWGAALLDAEPAPAPTLQGKSQTTGAVLRMELEGANPGARITGADALPGKSNYFIGNDPKEWHLNVPTYAKVRYQGVYPGVDLVYYGNPNKGGELENDFVIAPGADPGVIRLSIKGADRLSLSANGDLVIAAGGGSILLHKPVVYQESEMELSSAGGTKNGKKYLPGHYKLEANGQISFKLGAYDPSKSLVIDPVLSYSTYLGGTNVDIGTRVAVDSSGDAYITGLTSSTDFPNAAGTLNQGVGGPSCSVRLLFTSQALSPCPDAFVTKLSPDGQTILYSTFLGGSRGDEATGISVDSSGNVFLSGSTVSPDFPITSGAFQTSLQGHSDAFVSKLNATGSGLLYSTFIGGSTDDMATGIATDSAGNASIAGVTFSSDFPATQGSYQATKATAVCAQSLTSFSSPCPDAFVAKLNSAGSALAYATYLGGNNYDGATSIALDGNGSAYVTGLTSSTDFPTTSGAFQVSPSGATCGPASDPYPCVQSFVTKLSPAGDSLSYSTYFGGNGDTAGTGIAADSSGNAYFTGFSNATNLPSTGQSFAMGTCGNATGSINCPDAFVAKLNSSGSALSYMTYLGGTSYEFATDVRVDGSGDAFVVGATGSLDFPVTGSPVQTDFGGGSCTVNLRGTTYNIYCPNAFLTVLGPTGSSSFSTFLGGAGGGIAFGVAVDTAGNAYLSGTTVSSDFPVANAEQPHLAGDSDVFLAKIGALSASAGTVTLAPATLSFGSQTVGTSSTSQTATLSNSGSSSITINGVSITGTDSGDFSQTKTCGGTLAGGGSCSISVTFTPTATGSRSATLSVSDSATSSPQTVALSGTGVSQGVTFSPSSLSFPSQDVGTTSAAQSVTVTNTGSGNLTFGAGAVTVSGANAADFALASDTCSGQTVAPNGACAVGITFMPSVAGSESATLNFTDNASGSPQTVSLTGTGATPNFTLSVASGSASSATVSAGGNASYSLTLAPMGGFNKAVSLACTGAPSKATCTVSPASVTLDGTNPANVTVNVTTTAASLAAPGPNAGPPPPGPFLLHEWWIALLLLLMMGVLAMAFSERRRRVPLMAGAVLLAAIAVGCGGGGSGGGGGTTVTNPGTPKGTYTLTVTATAGNFKYPTDLTLIVQ